MLIIGHRGARRERPENTVESFVHAQKAGCIAFELDVQLSRDLKLIVCHDATTLRTTGYRGAVSKLSKQHLVSLDARHHTAASKHPCPIPELEEVVEACENVVHWQFEVKTDSWFKLYLLHHRLASLIYHYALESVATVTSFDERLLRLFQRSYPDISTGYVCDEVSSLSIQKATKLNCQLIAFNQSALTGRFVEDAQKAGLEVSTWTVNEKGRAEEIKMMGVDSLITDRPTRMLKDFS